jgi:TolB-like protein/DNA-binding winged helix-turn-helix (wHTH) protein/Tfp pilus assembly protein PilF
MEAGAGYKQALKKLQKCCKSPGGRGKIELRRRGEAWRVLAGGDRFEFEAFRLDRRGEGLLRRDERGVLAPVAIGMRALDVLSVLVDKAGQLVTKEELIAAVWGRTVVENANLTVQISALRRVLDRGRAEGSCIQTVAARGYRFTAPVTRIEQDAPSPQSSPDGDAVAPLPPMSAPRLPSRRPRATPAIVAAAASALLVVAGAAWWRWPVPALPAAGTPTIGAASGPAAAPRLSIVVLPFANLSDERDQQYFADGITDDLTTDLSRLADMFVIARNTAFTYKDKPIDARRIGRELAVRYVLEGSVRRSGDQVRINAQLVDAETGAHLWAERFDRDTRDLLAVQNEITSRIAATLHLELVSAEAARPIERSDAMDCILRGRAASYKSPTRDSYAEAVGWFERALSLDPGSNEARSLLASTLAARALDRMTDTSAADFARAEALAREVLAVSPLSPMAHYAYGQVLRATRRNEQCIPEYEEALSFNRSWANATADLGWCKFWVGLLDEAIALHERAIRLSPRDPQIGYWYHRIGMVHLLQSRIREAIPWLEKGRSALPTFPLAYSFLGAAYALNGETERGAAELAETYRLSGRVWVSTIADMKVTGYWGPPKIRELYEQVYFAGLRKLGVPEE